MAYTIEMIEHFDKIPEKDAVLNVKNTFSVPFRRHGVESTENPEKTRDEKLRTPLERLFIPHDILSKGEEILKKKRFTPEYLVNLQGVKLEGQTVTVNANFINYGVIPALRELTGIFPENVMLPVLDQLAAIAVRAVLISPNNGNLYLARRANVDKSGKIDTYPAGTVSEGYDLTTALRREAVEESGIRLDEDGTAYLVGLSKGRSDGPNPNFVYIIETPWSFEQVNKNTSIKEHDKVFAIELDEKKVKEHIMKDIILTTPEHSNITDVGLAALLQAGRAIFGAMWYKEITNELKDLESPKINIIERN